jgi:hypothetical protein
VVAHTAEFCLPYFEGSDSPCLDTGTVCDPSTVWCDMAAIIDAAFTGFDETISRAVESFPYAQVAVSGVPFTFSSGTSNLFSVVVPWDTVVGDSDGMVDLDTNVNTVNLLRSGIWNLNCIVVWRNDISDSELRVRLVHPGLPKITVFTSTIQETWVEPVPDPTTAFLGRTLGLSNVLDMFWPVDVSTGPVPLQIELEVLAGVGGHDPIIEVCRFSARWVADLP